MVRWHGNSRSCADSAAPANLLLGGCCGRLALLVIALGLVLMHHVVSAHQHSLPDIDAAAAPAHSSVDQAAPTAGGHHHGGDAVPAHQGVTPTPPDATPVAGSAALLHQHPDENGHDHAGSLLHMCLVALVGAAVFLLVLVLVALWWRPPPSRLQGVGSAPATAPRAPPASSRLAELQVLRL